MKDLFKKDKARVALFMLPLLISLVLLIIKIGFSLWFWLILVFWVIIFIVFFAKFLKHTLVFVWLIAMSFSIFIVFTFSILVSYGVIFANKTANTSSTKSKEIVLADCTSKLSDTPKMVDSWKSTIFAAPLISPTPDPDQANSVRTFSYAGIKNKTEANSLYVRIERSDPSSYITGYGTTMEACDANNKATKSYTTAQEDRVAGDTTTATIHYFHGGGYLHSTGDYRVDIYLKTLDGKWHLIDRMTGITITE